MQSANGDRRSSEVSIATATDRIGCTFDGHAAAIGDRMFVDPVGHVRHGGTVRLVSKSGGTPPRTTGRPDRRPSGGEGAC